MPNENLVRKTNANVKEAIQNISLSENRDNCDAIEKHIWVHSNVDSDLWAILRDVSIPLLLVE